MQHSMTFDYPNTAGHRGVETSIEAADKVDRKRGKKLKCYADIVRFLEMRGAYGGTSYEFCDSSAYKHNYAQPRFTELYLQGKIKKGSQRRKNNDGNNSGVWLYGEMKGLSLEVRTSDFLSENTGSIPVAPT